MWRLQIVDLDKGSYVVMPRAQDRQAQPGGGNSRVRHSRPSISNNANLSLAATSVESRWFRIGKVGIVGIDP